MGYTMSVRFKNIDERDFFLSFLAKHEDTLEKLCRQNKEGGHIYPQTAEHGDYSPSKNSDKLIIFNDVITTHALWALTAWLSIHSSYRFKEKAVLYYDTEKHFIIPFNKKEPNIIVDERGISVKKGNNPFVDYDKTRNVIREIDDLFQAYCLQQQEHSNVVKKLKVL